MDLSCIVLAGGKSTRLGRNKLAETVGKKSLLDRVVSRLICLQTEIIVVSASDSSLPQLPGYPELKIVNDIFPGKGSLGGVYTGLVSSLSFTNLVVACDMPFLNLKLIRYMMDQAHDCDVVIPRLNGVLEPLHALYTKNCIPRAESLIEQNRLSILELYPMVTVKYIENETIDQYDPQHLSFYNINTEKDLQLGKELAGKEELTNDKC